MRNIKYISVILYFVSVFLNTEVNAYAVSNQKLIGDTLQTKEYLLQLSKRKIERSDYAIDKDQFIDRYSFNKRTERVIEHYFRKRNLIQVSDVFGRNNSMGIFLENTLYALFNFSRFSCGVDAVVFLFAILFFVSALAVIAAVALLLLAGILLINIIKLVTFSRRKLLLTLIDIASDN